MLSGPSPSGSHPTRKPGSWRDSPHPACETTGMTVPAPARLLGWPAATLLPAPSSLWPRMGVGPSVLPHSGLARKDHCYSTVTDQETRPGARACGTRPRPHNEQAEAHPRFKPSPEPLGSTCQTDLKSTRGLTNGGLSTWGHTAWSGPGHRWCRRQRAADGTRRRPGADTQGGLISPAWSKEPNLARRNMTGRMWSPTLRPQNPADEPQMGRGGSRQQ